MTRIGRVKAWDTKDPVNPRFRLVIEGGKVTLGCWRYVGEEDQPAERSLPYVPTRAIFERVS